MSLLQSTILSLPWGVYTKIVSSGQGLSGGQTQRLALARARLRDTPVLILDEVTSWLYRESTLFVIETTRAWRRARQPDSPSKPCSAEPPPIDTPEREMVQTDSTAPLWWPSCAGCGGNSTVCQAKQHCTPSVEALCTRLRHGRRSAFVQARAEEDHSRTARVQHQVCLGSHLDIFAQLDLQKQAEAHCGLGTLLRHCRSYTSLLLLFFSTSCYILGYWRPSNHWPRMGCHHQGYLYFWGNTLWKTPVRLGQTLFVWKRSRVFFDNQNHGSMIPRTW
ncbi:hypothetical protein LX36DRAFT_360159 [Colletotrichum falcatum]|nr:hypothetical protein LX36DRAFT_360159 [Colletotrichum falcatum]